MKLPRVILKHRKLKSEALIRSKNITPVSKNIYPRIYVDLTYRCNMDCNFCYNPQRDLEEMSLSYFEKVCEQLPKKVQFRFLGGEPTLHKQFLKFIKVAFKYRHLSSVVSNGLTFTDLAFTQSIKNLNIPLVIGLTLNGGRNRNDWYEAIDNSRCANAKMLALDNLTTVGFKRLTISAIIIRGLNEDVIPQLFDIASQYPSVRYIHLRSAGRVGRFKDVTPYTTSELRSLLSKYVPAAQRPQRIINSGYDNKVCQNCCNEFQLSTGVQVGLIEFASAKSAKCWKRGKLMNDFTIEPFFENMLNFSESLK